MTPDDPIHQPHDKLFKASFSDPATAAGFLKWEIPAALAEAIDWSSLRVEPGTFVDSQFRHTESDLLYSAALTNQPCLIYVLFEHQTTPDPAIALRLLRYQVGIWESVLSNNALPPRLPVIFPVVLTQTAGHWHLEPTFASLFCLPDGLEETVRPFIPDFTFRLIQLADLPFESIRGTPSGIMTLRVMKAERTGELLGDPVWDETLLIQLPREVLIRYMLGADIDKKSFDRKVFTITHPELQSTAMSLAQQLRQEGRQEGKLEGKLEGRLEGRQDSVIDLLRLRFGQVPVGLEEAIREITDQARLMELQAVVLRFPAWRNLRPLSEKPQWLTCGRGFKKSRHRS